MSLRGVESTDSVSFDVRADSIVTGVACGAGCRGWRSTVGTGGASARSQQGARQAGQGAARLANIGEG